MEISLDKLRTDGGTQPRAEIDDTVVAEYADAMQEGTTFPPVVAFFDGKDYWLADGYHRAGAAVRLERESIECEVKQGTRRDAVLFSVSANSAHGLRRTNADKRRAVITLLEDEEWSTWPVPKIATQACVSERLVWTLKKEHPHLMHNAVDIKTVERNGTTFQMDTSRIGSTRQPEQRRETKEYCKVCNMWFVGQCRCIQAKATEPNKLVQPEPPSSKYITVSQWEKLSKKEQRNILDSPRSKSFVFNQTNDNVEWAMWTWNPITGCLHNCAYCYARDIALRFYEQGFEPTFIPERLDGPKNTKVPEIAKTELGYGNVFTCSMADLFGKWVPQEWIDAVLDVMADQKQWNYLVLTKFPQRLSEQDWPQNTWVGASIDRQARVKETLKSFDKVKRHSNAAITWLSLEPLLEPLKFDSLEMFDMVVIGGASASTQTPKFMPPVRWIADIMTQADKDGAAVYLKTNGRPREYPGRKPSSDLIAPSEFNLVNIQAKA